MSPAEYIALAVMAINLAKKIKELAVKKTEEDETLSLEKKRELIERVMDAQAGVTKID